MKKALHATQNKIYFVTNQRYLIPGVILSVAALTRIVAAETFSLRIALGVGCFWLAIWNIFVVILVRQALRQWKGTRAAGSNPKLVKQARSSALFALPFVAADVVGLCVLAWTTSVFVFLILLALAGANLLFHSALRAPTRAGRELLDKIQGFRIYLRSVDGNRLNQLMPPEKTPELFERYLPYALALDCELAWAQQFSTVLEAAKQSGGTPPIGMWGTDLSRCLPFLLPLASPFPTRSLAPLPRRAQAREPAAEDSGGRRRRRGWRRLVGSIHSWRQHETLCTLRNQPPAGPLTGT